MLCDQDSRVPICLVARIIFLNAQAQLGNELNICSIPICVNCSLNVIDYSLR